MSTATQSYAQATSPTAWTDAGLAPVYADALEAAGFSYCRNIGWRHGRRLVKPVEALEVIRAYVVAGAASSTDLHIRQAWSYAGRFSRMANGLKLAQGVLLARADARKAEATS